MISILEAYHYTRDMLPERRRRRAMIKIRYRDGLSSAMHDEREYGISRKNGEAKGRRNKRDYSAINRVKYEDFATASA